MKKPFHSGLFSILCLKNALLEEDYFDKLIGFVSSQNVSHTLSQRRFCKA